MTLADPDFAKLPQDTPNITDTIYVKYSNGGQGITKRYYNTWKDEAGLWVKSYIGVMLDMAARCRLRIGGRMCRVIPIAGIKGTAENRRRVELVVSNGPFKQESQSGAGDTDGSNQDGRQRDIIGNVGPVPPSLPKTAGQVDWAMSNRLAVILRHKVLQYAQALAHQSNDESQQ